MAQQVSTNTFGVAKWIVSATASDGTHTTISAALTSASSGDTIFIRPGTYTENLTLKAGVNLVSFAADALTPNVSLAGTCTFTAAGTVSMSGVRLTTNSAAFLAVTGSAASIVNLYECFLNASNNNGITFSSSDAGAKIAAFNCRGDIGTSGINLFAHSSAGTLSFRYSTMGNSGGSSTANTCSAGTVISIDSNFSNPITLSGTGALEIDKGTIDTSATNSTSLTLGGSGTQVGRFVKFSSGSASAVSIGGTATLEYCTVSSTNTNAITGAGTLNYSNLSFDNTSNTINTSTVTPLVSRYGVQLSATVPAFLVNKAAGAADVTGNSTTYTIAYDTEIFDQGSNFAANTFTAPYTGKYYLSGGCALSSVTTATSATFLINTSNRTYRSNFCSPTVVQDSVGRVSFSMNSLCDMDVGDTAIVSIALTGIGADTADLLSSNVTNIFSGYLVC